MIYPTIASAPVIPDSTDEITANWLTAVLSDAGALDGDAVAAIRCETIGVGVGFGGRVARLHVDYEAGTGPLSVVAKFSPLDPAVRALFTRMRVTEREVEFYRQLAPVAGIGTPRCYHAAYDAETGAGILLLEDLTNGRFGDNLVGASLEEVELVARHLAAFHSRWWSMGTPPAELAWLPSADDDLDGLQVVYDRALAGFAEQWGHLASPSLIHAAELYRHRLKAVRTALARPPWTIVHGDVRLDNLFFGSPDSGRPLVLLDWQIFVRGRGPCDLVYFMTGSLPVAARREAETRIVETYHRCLVEAGVHGYSLDECWHDYRLAATQVMQRRIVVAGNLDYSTPRGRAYMASTFERLNALVDDLNVHALLS